MFRESRELLKATEEVECIVLAGQGDPALHTGIGDLLRKLSVRTNLPVAVRTTGALLTRKSISFALRSASHVMVKLDAIDREMFHRVHRPHKGVQSGRFVAALRRFREDFAGSFLIETVVIAGVNDAASSITRLFDTLRSLEPHRVLLYLHTDADEEVFQRRIREWGRLGMDCDELPVVFITGLNHIPEHHRGDAVIPSASSGIGTWEIMIHRQQCGALARCGHNSGL